MTSIIGWMERLIQTVSIGMNFVPNNISCGIGHNDYLYDSWEIMTD